MLPKEASELDGRPDKVLLGAGSYCVNTFIKMATPVKFTYLGEGAPKSSLHAHTHTQSTEKLALEEE